MSVLYPRLLDKAARSMHEEYTTLTIAELRGRAATKHPAAVFTATGGHRVVESQLKDLRTAIVLEAERAGFPAEGRRADQSAFDLAVARLLHERSGLVAAEASARSAWAFLALVVVPDVAYWRYPRPPVDRVLGTDITRHVLGRLWWRAHLLHDPEATSDPYRLLGVFGEAAFDQIFARRSIGGSRALVRALAMAGTDRLDERDVLRDVLKRLLRLGGVIDFESLSGQGLVELVEETTEITIGALAGRSGRWVPPVLPDHDVARTAASTTSAAPTDSSCSQNLSTVHPRSSR